MDQFSFIILLTFLVELFEMRSHISLLRTLAILSVLVKIFHLFNISEFEIRISCTLIDWFEIVLSGAGRLRLAHFPGLLLVVLKELIILC